MIPDFIASTDTWLLRYQSGEFSIHEKYMGEGGGAYYGVTWDNESLYITEGDCVVKRKGSDREILPYKGSHLHQICFYDGRLYVVNTGGNVIDIIDPDTYEVETIDLHGKPGVDDEHINSIFFTDDHVYVCNHNHSQSFISVFTKDFKEKVREIRNIGQYSHNIYVEDDWVVTLDSVGKRIVRATGLNRAFVNLKDLDLDGCTYLRGMAKSKDFYIIGSSKWGERGDRNGSRIIVLNNQFEVVEIMKVPVDSLIREIRITSEEDFAHNASVAHLEEQEFPKL